MDEKQFRLLKLARKDSRCVSGDETRFLASEVERLQTAINDLCKIGRKRINPQDKVIEMRSLAVRHERKPV